ncbi:MAG: hypothetical protein WCQ21_19080, partial [Verrucomicrobiota bacterium]
VAQVVVPPNGTTEGVVARWRSGDTTPLGLRIARTLTQGSLADSVAGLEDTIPLGLQKAEIRRSKAERSPKRARVSVFGFPAAVRLKNRLFGESETQVRVELSDWVSGREGHKWLAKGGRKWELPIMKSTMVDDRRRIVMPQACPPHSSVTIQQVDDTTWIIKRQLPSKDYKMILIPVIDRLPDDPEWDKVEAAFVRHAASTVSEPEE